MFFCISADEIFSYKKGIYKTVLYKIADQKKVSETPPTAFENEHPQFLPPIKKRGLTLLKLSRFETKLMGSGFMVGSSSSSSGWLWRSGVKAHFTPNSFPHTHKHHGNLAQHVNSYLQSGQRENM